MPQIDHLYVSINSNVLFNRELKITMRLARRHTGRFGGGAAMPRSGIKYTKTFSIRPYDPVVPDIGKALAT